MEWLIWLGIAACLVQSGLFSGLNLALLGLSRLQLEVEAKGGNKAAEKILALRVDSNFLLTTVLWGNVGVNCLLTLLSDSVMAGVGAFLFATVGITLVGEIAPQAYFSRNAMKIGAALVPFIKLYQKILYPVAKPTAMILDRWLGEEEISYFRERELREVISHHMDSADADLEKTEGLGVLNFLKLDDLPGRPGGRADRPDEHRQPARRPRPAGLPRLHRLRLRPVPASDPGERTQVDHRDRQRGRAATRARRGRVPARDDVLGSARPIRIASATDRSS